MSATRCGFNRSIRGDLLGHCLYDQIWANLTGQRGTYAQQILRQFRYRSDRAGGRYTRPEQESRPVVRSHEDVPFHRQLLPGLTRFNACAFGEAQFGAAPYWPR